MSRSNPAAGDRRARIWEGTIGAAPISFLVLSIWQPAVAEELHARGIVQSKLVRALGRASGLLIASVLFAGMHLAGDLAGVPFLGALRVDLATLAGYFVFRAAAGLALGVVDLRTASLVPSVVLHYLRDFGGPALAWLL